jgi:tRNA A-37 threonylcarbamoyl transferase component Bud32
LFRYFSLSTGGTPHRFFCISRHQDDVHSILIDHKPSLVATVNRQQQVVKLVKARSWHEYVKQLWNHSRLSKEIKGNRTLQQIGIRVPQIYETGVNLRPFAKPHYLGYYAMEDLAQAGYREFEALVNDPATPPELLTTAMQNVVADLHRMKQHNVVFSDINKRNIYISAEGHSAWIDTGVKVFPATKQQRFRAAYNHAVSKFIHNNRHQLPPACSLAAMEQLLFNPVTAPSAPASTNADTGARTLD